MNKAILTCCVFLTLFILPAAVSGSVQTPCAVEGVLDLRNWHLEKDGSINLSGEWEFYWKQLLEPAAFTGQEKPAMTGYIDLPRPWNGYVVEGRELPAHGCATFRLRVLLPDDKNHLGIRVNQIFHAYRLWINEKMILTGGVPAIDRVSMVPNRSVKTGSFQADRNELQVLLQVSNFHHFKGGIRYPLTLGVADQIAWIHNRNTAFDLFLFGSLLIMTIYHLGLFYFRRSDRSILYFGLFCFLFALRALFIGEVFISSILPDINWELQLTIEFLTYYFIIPAGALFYYSLFPKDMSRSVLRGILILGALFVLLVLLTPTRIYSQSLYAYHLYSVLSCLYVIAVLIVSTLRRREGALLFLIGIIVLIVAGFNDALLTMDLIRTVQLIHFGFFVFIFFQAYVLSTRFARAFTTVENQTEELSQLNVSYEQEIAERRRVEEELKRYRDQLEELVKERTAEIISVNAQLIHEIDERKRAEKRITESLKEKEVLLMEIHHRVKNNMQVISSLLNLQSRYVIDERDRQLFSDSQNRVRSMALVHEKLYQSDDLARIDFADYITKLTQQLISSYGMHGISITVQAANMFLTIEQAIPCALIVNELVSNALKYAFPDGQRGTIEIHFSKENDYYRLIVQDNGIGMPHDFETEHTDSLGLELVSILTKQLQGTIEREETEGTRYSITFQ